MNEENQKSDKDLLRYELRGGAAFFGILGVSEKMRKGGSAEGERE